MKKKFGEQIRMSSQTYIGCLFQCAFRITLSFPEGMMPPGIIDMGVFHISREANFVVPFYLAPTEQMAARQFKVSQQTMSKRLKNGDKRKGEFHLGSQIDSLLDKLN